MLAATAASKVMRKDFEFLQLETLRDHPILTARIPLEAIANSKPLNVTEDIEEWYAAKTTVCAETGKHFTDGFEETDFSNSMSD